MNQRPVQQVMFGEGAIRYMREQLEFAATEFDGTLAKSLERKQLSTPFGFVSPDATQIAEQWDQGGVDDEGASDAALARAVGAWIQRPDADRERCLLLEEAIAGYSDPATEPGALHRGEQIYFRAVAGEGPESIARALKEVNGYPGIGVLARPAIGIADGGGAMSSLELSSISDSAVALLVRAWDDEGFVIALIDERVSADELVF